MATRAVLPAVVVILISSLGGCGSSNGQGGATSAAQADSRYVTALGRVTPGRAVMEISAQAGTRLRSLEVREGQHVRRGNPLAYLDDYPLRLAQRDAAMAALAEAREGLSASTRFSRAQIEQNRNAVRLAEVALNYEEREVARMRELTTRGAVPRQRLIDRQFQFDSRSAELHKARAELSAAQAALEQTRSNARIQSAEAAVRTAEAQLELTIIRAPMDGEILRIFTYAGERIDDSPILSMSDTRDMNVLAAVYETDIRRVRVGQRASVSSPALPEPIFGRVEQVGALVYRNDILALDPRSPRDARVVEVRIKLAPSAAVSRLSNLEVTTRIDTAGTR